MKPISKQLKITYQYSPKLYSEEEEEKEEDLLAMLKCIQEFLSKTLYLAIMWLQF